MGKNRQFYEKNIKVPTKFLQFAKKCFFEFLQIEKVSQMFTGIVLCKYKKDFNRATQENYRGRMKRAVVGRYAWRFPLR